MLFVSCSIPRTMSYRALPYQRTPQRIPSTSSAYPPYQFKTANSKSAMLAQVCLLLFLHPLHLIPTSPPPGSHRSYTPIKTLGDGSFGTVLLCDWHGTLPPNTPLSPMQCGGGARPEWAGKRLVAVKRMKKKWEGGWDECKRLKELEVRFPPSSSTSPHPPTSRSVQSPSTHASYPSTTSFSCQIPRSFTLFLRAWRAIYITSSRLEKAVLSPVASWLPSSNKSFRASTTYMLLVIFTGT